MEAGSFLEEIKPPRLEDAGLEDCALPPESIKEAFLKAASAVRSIISGDEGEGRCVEDPWEDTSDTLVGITEGVTGPSEGCVAEKGSGLTEAPGDKVAVGGGSVDAEAEVDEVVGPGLPKGGEACVDGLQGLKIGGKNGGILGNKLEGRKDGVDEDEDEQNEEKPILAEGNKIDYAKLYKMQTGQSPPRDAPSTRRDSERTRAPPGGGPRTGPARGGRSTSSGAGGRAASSSCGGSDRGARACDDPIHLPPPHADGTRRSAECEVVPLGDVESAGSRRKRPCPPSDLVYTSSDGLFFCGQNIQGPKSFWDIADHSCGSEVLRPIITPFDESRLATRSDHALADSFHREQAATTFTAMFDRSQCSISESSHQRKMKELTDEVSRLQDELKAANESKAKLGDEHKRSREKLHAERTTGSTFLKSEVGRAFIDVEVKKGVDSFKESQDFDDAVFERAQIVFSSVIRDCRRELRRLGRIPEEDIMRLFPKIKDDAPISEDTGDPVVPAADDLVADAEMVDFEGDEEPCTAEADDFGTSELPPA